MWATGSAFIDSAISTRTLDPIKTGRFWDPQGHFIRAYVPELRNMPLQFLFTPWTAPLDVQEIANCRVGTDYPQPILNHKTARAQNIKQIEELNSQMEQMNLWSSYWSINIIGRTIRLVDIKESTWLVDIDLILNISSIPGRPLMGVLIHFLTNPTLWLDQNPLIWLVEGMTTVFTELVPSGWTRNDGHVSQPISFFTATGHTTYTFSYGYHTFTR